MIFKANANSFKGIISYILVVIAFKHEDSKLSHGRLNEYNMLRYSTKRSLYLVSVTHN